MKTSSSTVLILVIIAVIGLFNTFDAPLVNSENNRISEQLFWFSKSLTEVELFGVPHQGGADSEIVRHPLVSPKIAVPISANTQYNTKHFPIDSLMLWSRILIKTIYQGSSDFV